MWERWRRGGNNHDKYEGGGTGRLFPGGKRVKFIKGGKRCQINLRKKMGIGFRNESI
jgi:hypothetical protein